MKCVLQHTESCQYLEVKIRAVMCAVVHMFGVIQVSFFGGLDKKFLPPEPLFLKKNCALWS
jgi:hypothetical protein